MSSVTFYTSNDLVAAVIPLPDWSDVAMTVLYNGVEKRTAAPSTPDMEADEVAEVADTEHNEGLCTVTLHTTCNVMQHYATIENVTRESAAEVAEQLQSIYQKRKWKSDRVEPPIDLILRCQAEMLKTITEKNTGKSTKNSTDTTVNTESTANGTLTTTVEYTEYDNTNVDNTEPEITENAEGSEAVATEPKKSFAFWH